MAASDSNDSGPQADPTPDASQLADAGPSSPPSALASVLATAIERHKSSAPAPASAPASPVIEAATADADPPDEAEPPSSRDPEPTSSRDREPPSGPDPEKDAEVPPSSEPRRRPNPSGEPEPADVEFAEVQPPLNDEPPLGRESDPPVGDLSQAALLPPAAARPAHLRRPPRWMFVTGALVLLLALITLLPWYLLTRAERRSTTCFDQLVSSGEGDALACVPSDGELALPTLIPWLRPDAERLASEREGRALQLSYAQASAIQPSAEARRVAGQRLLDRRGGYGLPPTLSAAARMLDGDFEQVAEFASKSDDKELRAFAFPSARAVVDGPALLALSRGADAAEPHALNLQRGAVLCLLDAKDDGVAVLLAADRNHRSVSERSDGYGFARLAMIACGQVKPRGEFDPRNVLARFRSARAALEASQGSAQGLDRARVLLLDPQVAISGAERLRIAAYAISTQQPDPLAALALLAPRHGAAAAFDSDALFSPWSLLDPSEPEHAVMVEPSVASAAAAHLEILVAELEGAGPLRCAGDECPVEVALGIPQILLREAARMLWLEAAIESHRRMDREAAMMATAKAEALTPGRRLHEIASVYVAIGASKRALAVIDRVESEVVRASPWLRARTSFLRALALVQASRFDGAYTPAEQALTLALSLERAKDGGGAEQKVLRKRLQRSAAWLWAALALRNAKGATIEELLRGHGDPLLSGVVEWLDLARAPEDQKRARRWSLRLRDPEPGALPAVIDVVAAVAPEGSDRSVWLDRVLNDAHRVQPVRLMRARAEAARWRGDGVAEAAWKARASAATSLVRSYSGAFLAHLARLR